MKKILLSALIACSLVSAHAAVLTYDAILDGPTEGNASPGTGFGEVVYNSVAHSLSVHASFTGLTGTTTASHIHAATTLPGTGTAGVATTTPTFAGFPLGVTSGTYDNILDLTQASSYNPSYITANGGTTASAELALMNAIANGQAYLNIHSSTFGGGEIRGFLTLVPEPSSLALLGLGAVVMVGRARSKRRMNNA